MTTKKTPTRIYCVKSTADGAKPRLVRATHPSTALRFVADAAYTVTIPDSEQLLGCFEAGIKPEDLPGSEQQLLT